MHCRARYPGRQFALVLNCLLLLGADSPELNVIAEHNVTVPMRDAVVLRANVFRPDRGGPYLVLVMRTPYGKSNGGLDRYVKAGYEAFHDWT